MINFEHSSVPTSLIKHKNKNKNNWALYVTLLLFHGTLIIVLLFCIVEQKPFVNLPKNLGKGTQTTENIKK